MPDKQQLLDSAEQALRSLYIARDKIADAKAIGVWDMLGGGIFSSLLKHKRIEEVDDCLAAAEENLRLLLGKLEAWPEDIYLRDDVGDGLKFVDIAFDNVFTDIIVQDKITKAQRQIEEIICQVQNLVAVLKD